MSGKRKKTAEEKEFSAKRENTTVVCKLSRVCKDPDILAEIQRTCIILKQVQLEAWRIANLHILRCLENDIELPTLDQTFFTWCCQGARAARIRVAKPKAEKEIKVDRQRKLARLVDDGLRETVHLYRTERESVKGYTIPQLEYDGNDILQLADQMRVNAENMVVLHFEKRLFMYARLLLEEKPEKTVLASEVKQLVRACCRAEGVDFADDETKLRAWLGFVPYENVIKDNLEHFVAKLYEILRKVEASQMKNPNKKGIRSFSLLLYSSSYSTAHIVINGSTLQGFCERIFKETDGRNPLDIPLTQSGKVLQSKEEVCKKKELFLRRGFAVSQFEIMAPNDSISKREFDKMDHASKSPFASRLFANQITTNGYSALVLLTRLKLETENGKKKSRTQQTKNEDVFDGEWLSLPNDYEADALIAIDPGMRSLYTAVSEGGVKNKKKKKKATHVSRVPRQVGDETVHSVSTKEYRHLTGMNKAHFWHENLKRRKKRYARTISGIPSCKTSSFDKYKWRLKTFWKHVSFLLEFCAGNAFLKWRFFQSRMKEKAADVMAKRIVPIASPRVLIGYGDWSRRDGISGHAPSPVKGLKKALKKRATAVPIDEYRTSKLCSNCHSPLEQALLPTKIKDKEVVLKKTSNVLRCPTSSCKATFWNRDVNAARNIMSLLKCELLGLGRLEAFCRG